MSLGILIIILICCVILEGFFSGSEMAVVNADKYRLAIGTDKGSKFALAALHLIKHPALFFSITLLGTNLCTVTGSVVITLYIISNYGSSYAPLAIVFWPITLFFGEMVPKSIYQYRADKMVLKVAPVLIFFSWIFFFLVWPLSWLTDFLLGSVKSKVGNEPPLTREELELMVEQDPQYYSDVKQEERDMISCILDLAEKKVANIMTPLIDVVSISIGATRDEASALMEKHGFSRILVFQAKAFNIVGVLNGVDLLFSDDFVPLEQLVKKAFYVPENMPLDALLITMKRQAGPIVVVVDEFGSATGVVTDEDLLEEVVGEIRDEHDVISPLYKRLGYNHFVVNGRMEIEDVNDRLKLSIAEGDYETIAGYVIKKAERIPKTGESLKIGEYIYTILRVNERAIFEIEIKKETKTDEGSSEK
ncbi:MAG: hypothetical protein COS89_08095 [Deltaproteobacteria bacterium CG07_land_8_20_14_0_80_38_7]|nr:MAG: hypothetical protein COS89_08095 [Deltaproteobacteria bacterium CG07_land_8_20_14_0_80_38_7]